MESPLKKVYAGAMLGSEEFIEQTLHRIQNGCLGNAEVAGRQALRIAPDSEEILSVLCEHFGVTLEDAARNYRSLARKVGISLIKKHTSATNREIGAIFGDRGDAAVIKIFQRVSGERGEDDALRATIEKLQGQLSIVSG